MMSRLVVLSVLRELAAFGEKYGLDPEWVRDWTSEVASVICRPCHSIEEARLVEDTLAAKTRELLTAVRTDQ